MAKSDIWDWIKRQYDEIDQRILRGGVDINDPQVRDLTEILLSDEVPWAHSTPANKLFEATPEGANSFFHIGSPEAAAQRATTQDDYMSVLQNEIHRAKGTPEVPLEDSLRSIPLELRNIDNVAYGVDNGLITPLDHLLTQRPLPGNRQYDEFGKTVDQPMVVQPDELIEGGYGLPKPAGEMFVNDPDIVIPNLHSSDPRYQKAADKVIQRYQDEGIDAVVYPNREEDYGSLSIFPTKRGTVFNKLTGEKVYSAGGVGVLGAASQDAEADDYSFEMPGSEVIEKYAPESQVGGVSKFVMDMVTDFAGWRNNVNTDLYDDPLMALAAIPIGAIEEAWDLGNLAVEGWTALDKFIDQNDEPRRADQLLDKSEHYKNEFSEFFDEQGFPRSWRTVGGLTGLGVGSKAGKKGAELLYKGVNL